MAFTSKNKNKLIKCWDTEDDTPSCMEVSVKKEIQDYDDDDDDEIEIIDVDQTDNEVRARKVAEFRERLMNEVNRPYCEEECNRLSQHFNLRKPVQNYRSPRLRVVKKIYEGNYGKSYRDEYLDLEKANRCS